MIQLAPIVLMSLSFFAGTPVTVSCPSDLGWEVAGNADLVTGQINLIDYYCPWLNYFAKHGYPMKDYHMARDPKGWITERYDGTLDALVISLHESGHIRHPDWSEPCVQRFALRHLKHYARRLGASKKMAREVQRYGYWMTDFWMPLEYQPRYCVLPTDLPPYNPDRR